MVGLVHNISYAKPNSNYNTPDEVEKFEGLLTFDGIYYNVYLHQSLLEGKKGILFVMGEYVGKNNSFDIGQPFERYCDWNEIMELVNTYGFGLGWHTWTHPDLTQLTDQQVVKECTPPFPMDTFAYPYGRFDDRIIGIVKALGFKEAFSVTEGDDSEYQRLRSYLPT